jgi:TonB family protein
MKRSRLRSTLLAIAALGSLHVSAVAQSAGEAAAWESIRSQASAAQLMAFLDSYPAGQFAPEAPQKYSVAANTMPTPHVQTIEPRIPLEARRVARTLGPLRVVKLNILVQRDGKAGDVKLVETSGYDLYDREAIRAAQSATYLPALDNGMPVESRMDYEVSFGLLCNRAAGNTTCDNGRFPTTCSATVCERMLR